MVVPAAWQLYRSGAKIDWLCGTASIPLLDCYSWIRPIPINQEVLTKTKWRGFCELLRAWSNVGLRRYDLCAVLQYDSRYRLLTLPVRGTRHLHLSRRSRLLTLNCDRHHSDEYSRIVCGRKDEYTGHFAVPVRPDRLPPAPLSKASGTVRVALAPGGARNVLREDPLRRWPLASYRALAQALLQRGYEVVLTGGPGDRWVESEFVDVPVVNGIGKWSLAETLAFYDTCDVVVTHDSGPLHLAGIVNCAVIGLFGPVSPWERLPRRSQAVAIWGGERLACRPCYDGREYAPCSNNGCMQCISPTQVAQVVEETLAGRRDWHILSV
jgi:heptosyltransferase-2